MCQGDRVLFAEMLLTETPENGGGPFRPFGFQRSSLRYRGDKVHEDGAGIAHEIAQEEEGDERGRNADGQSARHRVGQCDEDPADLGDPALDSGLHGVGERERRRP